MTNSWDLVRSVLDKFRGLPVKLSGMTDKCEETYRSHGREPKTSNPIANGNVSPVTHYLRYVRLYEAADPGAGQMLSNRVFEALAAEFAENDLLDTSQPEIEVEIINETCDVEKWLSRYDLKAASRPELLEFDRECDEAIDTIMRAKGTARATLKLREVKRARN